MKPLERIMTQLDRIEAAQAEQSERLNSVDVRLAKYNAELEFHVARTSQLEDELNPIVKQVHQLKGAGLLVGFLSLCAGIATAVAKLWK